VKPFVAGLLLWLVGPGVAFAAPVEVQGIRLWSAPDHTRVVFDTSGPVKFELQTLHNPERVIIDVPVAAAGAAVSRQQKGNGLVKAVRTAQ